MLHRLLLAHAIGRVELLVAHPGSIGLEGIDLRNISLQEDLQCPDIDELGRVVHNLRKESVILLITSELSLSVGLTRDHHGIQSDAVLQHEHVRIEPQLPLAVAHRLRHDHLERQVDLSLSLGDVPEARSHGRCLKHLRSHHLARLLILDRLHDEDLRSVIFYDLQSVTRLRSIVLHLRHIALLLSQGQLHLRALALMKRIQFLLRRAGGKKRKAKHHAQYCQNVSLNSFHFSN